MPAILRLVREGDADQVAAIYEPYVRDTAITFAGAAPTGPEFLDRIHATIERLPWIVCERDDQAVGYAYAGSHRAAPAYRWSVETTIYVHPRYHRLGVGKALYSTLLEALRLLGYHYAYAGVAHPNDASIGLHQAMGFELVGTFPEVGYKLGAWRDVAWLGRKLGDSNSVPAEPRLLSELLGTPEWQAAIAAGQSLLR